MKILYPISSFFPAQNGGPSNSVYWLTKELSNVGHDIKIITTDECVETLPNNTWLKVNKLKVFYSHNFSKILPFRMLYMTCKAVGKTDIVHLNSLFFPISWFTVAISILKNKKIVWSPRGELSEKALIYSNWKKKPFLWFIKTFLAKKPIFHATCEEELSEIKANFGNDVKSFLIPNMIELESVQYKSKKLYFLYIGRIHPKKGLDNLICALSISKSFLDSNYIFKFVGDTNNNYYSKLKQLIKSLDLQHKIEFVGHKRDQEKDKLYANAFFTFMPSHTENFGNVVIESLARGTPVVASKGTPWKILETQKAGFWINNSPAEIGKAVDNILDMSLNTYADYRHNSLMLVKENFDIHRNIHLWVDAYNQILSEV